MSKKGINKTAKIFSIMQQTRMELLKNINDKQDLRLGQMLKKGKEAMQNVLLKLL